MLERHLIMIRLHFYIFQARHLYLSFFGNFRSHGQRYISSPVIGLIQRQACTKRYAVRSGEHPLPPRRRCAAGAKAGPKSFRNGKKNGRAARWSVASVTPTSGASDPRPISTGTGPSGVTTERMRFEYEEQQKRVQLDLFPFNDEIPF